MGPVPPVLTEDSGLALLIGAARSPAALPLLRTQLDSDDEALHSRAAAGLAELDTPGARTLLRRARANGTIS